jgi:hypothetical protein
VSFIDSLRIRIRSIEGALGVAIRFPNLSTTFLNPRKHKPIPNVLLIRNV